MQNDSITRLTYSDNLVIEVRNDTMEISTISHFMPIKEGDTVVYSETDLLNEIDYIFNLAEMDSSYLLVESVAFDDDYWQLTWIKEEKNGILNPYDGVDAFYNRYTKDLVTYSRFRKEPNTMAATLTEQNAWDVFHNNQMSSKLLDQTDYSSTTTSLVYTMPREKGLKNRDLNDAYLAYRFSVSDGAYTVYIDATTGEVLSADSERSLRAKAFSIADDPAFPYPNKQTSSAKSCFDKLGYVSYASFISSGLDLAGSIRTFIKQDDSYGFYLACHGDQTVLTNNRNWWIYPSEINGNWRFVFLDACYSAAGTAWSDRFHITNSSINRAFLGWSNTVNGYDSTAFTNIFFPEVTNKYHASNIRDAAVWAASQIPGAGTTPIRFYGDRTYDGRV